MNIYQQIENNKFQSLLVVGMFILFFLMLGFGFDYYNGFSAGVPVFTIITLIGASLTSLGGYLYGDRLVLASTHAHPIDGGNPKQQQWENVVQEMSIAAGIPLPKVYVIDDPDPNAFATGRNPQNASLAITTGLLDVLNRDELQGVAAHEISHIKNYDIRLMLIVSILLGSVALLSDWAARSMLYRGRRRSRDSGSGQAIIMVIWLLAIILAPLVSQLMAMCVSRRREYLADASGAQLTRNPLGLASALEKIAAHTEPTRSIHRGNAHLCIIDPKGQALGFKEGFKADLFASHPPIQKRIAALKEMAYMERT